MQILLTQAQMSLTGAQKNKKMAVMLRSRPLLKWGRGRPGRGRDGLLLDMAGLMPVSPCHDGLSGGF